MIPSFEWFTLVPAVDWWSSGWAEVFLIAASSGAVGMGLSDLASGLSDRLSGGNDDGGGFAGADDLAGGDGFDDDFGDDEFGEFGEWDDDGDDLDEWGGGDGLDNVGGDGGGNSDLEPRLDELENEVATISSTIGTVRSENEAINETVEDIEDNIRKLLDIYEMVTRGVNPFVDDAQTGGGMGGSFGLFDDADADGFDDLDPDVADADPDSFFDDDFDGDAFDDDDDFEDGDFEDGDFAADDGEAVADEIARGGAGDDLADEGTSARPEGTESGSGKTFDELKSEYESGADWDADDGPAADGSATSGDVAATDGSATSGDVAATDGDLDDPAESVDTSSVDGAHSGGPPDDATGADQERPAVSPSDGGASDRKPYLESLPSGYGAELLVVEWLSYLRAHSSTAEALRAINYYENIGWIGARAASSLQEYLSGLAGEEVTSTSNRGTQLTIDHHTDSLRYIGELGGKRVDVERLEWSGPDRAGSRAKRRGQRGIQR